MPKLKYDKKFIDNLLKEYNAGETTTTLGRKYGMSDSQVGALLRRGGYTPRKALKHTVDMDLIKQLKLEGKTNKEIADFLGVKLLTLKDWKLSQFDGPLQDKFGKKHQKIEDYFQDINSEEKAYILGFITADGSITPRGALRIELSIKDKELLEKISSRLCPGYTLQHYSRQKEYKGSTRTCETVAFNISCARWRDDLSKLGVVPAKTYKSILMPELDKELRRHYIRGYLDGNGYVGKKRVEISGGFTLLNSILDELKTEGIGLNRVVKQKPNQKDSLLCLLRRADEKNLYKYLYTDASLFLERKRSAF